MSTIKLSADTIRILSAAMVEKAKSGHPGGAMGGADFINVLYAEFLNFKPNAGDWMFRDRFFLDPGHMSPMLYSILCLSGFYEIDELKEFRQWNSPTPGHPEKDLKRGVENTSGPLGVGHTMAVGAAIAEKFMTARFGEIVSHKTFAFISDGGIQEEISQGAGRIAGHLGLSNLIMFYDSNDIQLSTVTNEVTSEDTAAKYKAWGWNVLNIDGNNADEIRMSLQSAYKETERPTLIIGKTIMGKGAVDERKESYERKTATHGMPLSAAGASFENTIENLGGNPKEPFKINSSVIEYWNEILQNKQANVSAKEDKVNQWKKDNPELYKKLESYYAMDFSYLNFSEIQQKLDNSTRGASGVVLSYLAENVENIIVSSADLSNSDKTDAFLNKSKAFTKNDFTGNFLQAGVCELTMAAIANGIALHGGIMPVCATFFVFSDYMKPAMRLAALMELPVKYVWTHDSFRVGEDGPTHQPVEHEAQVRLMESLKNHSGKNSLLVLRPADADETSVAWQMAIENADTPTALLLSRQNVKSIPPLNGNNRYRDALNAKFGGYTVYNNPDEADILLIANGSEVSTLYDAAQLIEKELKKKVSVVSVISEGLFRNQDQEYQHKIIPANVEKVGLTAGLPITLKGLVGEKGTVIGLDSFGFSAPAKVLDEKLGYNAENILSVVRDILK